MRILLALLAFVLLLIVSGWAMAQQLQPSCGPAIGILAQLSGKFRERPMFIGVSRDGTTTTRIYANPDTLTWTVLVLLPDGQACILASGEGIVSARPQPDGSPL